MKLFVILCLSSLLSLAASTKYRSKRRRESGKWDIIHHEYHGPPAPLAKDGRVIDTAEVAEAKANHLAIHAETVSELARLMAAANELDAEIPKESGGGAEEQQQPQGPEVAAAPIIAQPVEMTPELMAALTAAAGAEAQAQTGEAAPAGEAAPEAQGENQPEEPAAEQPKEEEKPVIEPESINEINADQPIVILQKSYEGPLAPIGDDGRVVDTIEVRKAKETHLIAYENAVKLAKTKKESEAAAAKPEEKPKQEPAWYEQRKKIFIPPVYLLFNHDGPIGYKGPKAPLGEDGRVVDTEEVNRAKADHRKAYEKAESLAKRHPPKKADNAI